MTKVFIGGSRSVSRLSAEVRGRLDQIVTQSFPVLIGDANGADKTAQRYFHERGYQNVEVFCVEGECRNNLGDWPVRSVKAPSDKKDFTYFSSKDLIMAREATVGFMLWDGESTGTLANISRLVEQGKPVLIYASTSKTFLELKTQSDWEKLLSDCPTPVRRRFVAKFGAVKKPLETPKALDLFSENLRWNPGTRS